MKIITFDQGVEPFNFSGSVWVQQRFKISAIRFGFAQLKNISTPVYKVSVQVRSKKWYDSSNTISKMKRTKQFFFALTGQYNA